MKKILFIILLFSTISNAQELENKFSSSLCECFDDNQTELKEDFEINILEKCLHSAFQLIEDEFSELILKDIDTTYLEIEDAYQYGFQYGFQYGQKIFGNIQEKLVNECDSYFEFSNKLISLMETNLAKESSQKKIDSLTGLINKSPMKIELLWERGANSIGVRDYKSAQLDFKKCLKIDSSYVPALFFLGCSYNLDDNPKKAIETFEIIIAQNKDFGSIGDMTKIYLAFLKRKIREK